MSATKSGDKIGPAEALELLSSALHYCQQAGLVVRAGNANGGVTIILAGVTITDGRFGVMVTSEVGDNLLPP